MKWPQRQINTFLGTVTAQGQITVPAPIRRSLGLAQGAKVDVFPLDHERFVARVHHPSRILDFADDLKHLDRRRTFKNQGQGVNPE